MARPVPVAPGVLDTKPVADRDVNGLTEAAGVRVTTAVLDGEAVENPDAETLGELDDVESKVIVIPDDRLGTVDELTEREPLGDELALTEAVPERVAPDRVGRALLLSEGDTVALLKDDTDRADEGVTAGEMESLSEADDELLRQSDALADAVAAAEREDVTVPVERALSDAE